MVGVVVVVVMEVLVLLVVETEAICCTWVLIRAASQTIGAQITHGCCWGQRLQHPSPCGGPEQKAHEGVEET